MTRATDRWVRALVAGVAFASAACSLPLRDNDLPYTNACSAAADCPGASCVATEIGNVCVARETDLGPVFLEVRASDVSGSTTSFLFTDSLILQESHPDGVVRRGVSLDLPQLVKVRGSYPALEGVPAECKDVATETVPVKVELRSTSLLPGVENQLTAISKPTEDGHVFQVPAPPGTYDVYLSPQAPPGCDAPPPARIFPKGLVVPNDVGEVNFAPESETPQYFSGEMTVPANYPLTGWFLEVVDPRYGKTLSQPYALEAPDGPSVDIPPIAYSYTADALLRLRSPEGDFAVHWLLSTVVDTAGHVSLYLNELKVPVALTGTVVGPGGSVPGASVTIQSKKLDGITNNATLRVTTKSDAAGGITVSLIPGTYLVTVVPASTGIGTHFGEWTVTEDGGGNAKGFELPVQPVLRANVLTAAGDLAAGAPVVATPSQLAQSSYFSQVLENLVPVPRQLTGSVDASGLLSLSVDPGNLDVAVEVDAQSGFPWVVRPRLVVSELTPSTDIGELRIPFPVVVEGTVSSLSGSSSLASVRAWVPASPVDGTLEGVPLVRIGATVADESGRFFLPLPPTVTQIAPEP